MPHFTRKRRNKRVRDDDETAAAPAATKARRGTFAPGAPKDSAALRGPASAPALTESAAAPRRKRGRTHTLSIAVPGSILANAQSAELQTYLAGQIARAATIFCVDEVVVFDDHTVKGGVTASAAVASAAASSTGAASSLGGGDACALMARLLQYVETPL